jgi:hypothetical protein
MPKFFVMNPPLNGQEWALQLWANDQFKIAELALGLPAAQWKRPAEPERHDCAAGAPPATANTPLPSPLFPAAEVFSIRWKTRAAFVQTVSFVQPRLPRRGQRPSFSGDENQPPDRDHRKSPRRRQL